MEIEVEQGDFRIGEPGENLYTTGLGPCIGVGGIFNERGFLLHSQDSQQESESVTDPFFEQVCALVPQSARSGVHPIIAGGCLEQYFGDASDAAINEDTLASRTYFLNRFGRLGFGAPIVRWCDPDFVQNLHVKTCDGEARLETVNCKAPKAKPSVELIQARLQGTELRVDVTESRHRRLGLVYVHTVEQTTVADDRHPTAYLHWAAQLPFRERLFEEAKQQGRGQQSLRLREDELKRTARMKDGLQLPYQQRRMAYGDAYIRWLETSKSKFDLVVCCPSSRDESRFLLEPLINAVRRRNPKALDLSPFFHKDASFKAGGGATVQEAYKRISFDYPGRLERMSSALVIDDVWSKGITVGAILRRLSDSGFRRNGQVTVFAPLRISTRLLEGCEY